MYDKFKHELPYRLLDTSKYPPEVAGRFNSFITTQFDDSLSVEMQMRSIIKWATDNFKLMDSEYNAFTDYIVNKNINPFIDFLNDLIEYMNEFIDTFDVRYQETILTKMQEWYDDGSLETLINESLDTKYHEMDDRLTAQLEQNTQSIIHLGDEKWGVVGDGETDDTDAFEDVLNYARENGCKIVIPKIDIKINRPITINFFDNESNYSFTLEGLGGSGANLSHVYGSRIIAYNIPDGRSAIELLGRRNGESTSVELSNVEIVLDEDTCGELSFCLTIGDGWLYTIRRVKFTGFNSVILRCGTHPDATSYANISCKFDQVHFNMPRYLDWNDVVNHKARYGFAVANERIFRENGYTPFMSDNITFDTCVFRGTVMDYITSSVFINCMFLKEFRPIVNISNDVRFNRGFFDFDEFDMSINHWVAGGKTTSINPYFEGAVSPVYVRTHSGYGTNVSIKNPSFIAVTPMTKLPSGEDVEFKYIIKTERPAGETSIMEIDGGTTSQPNRYKEGMVINHGCQVLKIVNVGYLKEEDVVDTYSTKKEIVSRWDYKPRSIELEFEGNIGQTREMTLIGSDISEYVFRGDYLLTRMEVIVPKHLEENHGFNMFVNGNLQMQLNDTGTSYSNFPHIERLRGVSSEIYRIENIPFLDTMRNVVRILRPFQFKKGDVLTVVAKKEQDPSNDQVDVILKLYFEG